MDTKLRTVRFAIFFGMLLGITHGLLTSDSSYAALNNQSGNFAGFVKIDTSFSPFTSHSLKSFPY